jgi:hypothetical protein
VAGSVADPGPNATATVSQAGPDSVRVRLSFTGPGVEYLSIQSEEAMRVETHEGYTRGSDGNWLWRGDGTPPDFVFTVAEDSHGYLHVNESWAVGSDGVLLPSFWYADGSESAWYEWGPGDVVADRGYATDELVLLGEYGTATTAGREAEVTAVVSGAVDGTEPDDAVETLAAVTRSLDVGGDPEHTTMVVVPASFSGPYGFAADSAFVIRGDAVWDGLMTHEFLHTRQEFATGADMEWLIEGSAFYYMSLVPYNRGTMDWERFERRIDGTGVDAVLTRNGSYAVAAARGAPVLAGLDRRIREATDNSRTLRDVYVRLNEHDTVTYDTFRAEVTAVAGPNVGLWLDTHVDGTAPVAPPERGQFVPGGWRPALDERLLVCRDGEWVPAASAAPLPAGEPVDTVYTGPGPVTLRGDYRTLDARAGACDRGSLGRLAGPGANRILTLVPRSDLTVVART